MDTQRFNTLLQEQNNIKNKYSRSRFKRMMEAKHLNRWNPLAQFQTNKHNCIVYYLEVPETPQNFENHKYIGGIKYPLNQSHPGNSYKGFFTKVRDNHYFTLDGDQISSKKLNIFSSSPDILNTIKYTNPGKALILTPEDVQKLKEVLFSYE
jgi:hypothetical protein